MFYLSSIGTIWEAVDHHNQKVVIRAIGVAAECDDLADIKPIAGNWLRVDDFHLDSMRTLIRLDNGSFILESDLG